MKIYPTLARALTLSCLIVTTHAAAYPLATLPALMHATKTQSEATQQQKMQQQETPEQTVMRNLSQLLGQKTLHAEQFAPSFLAQAPLNMLQAMWNDVFENYGAFKKITTEGDTWFAQYERGKLEVGAYRVDEKGRVLALLLKPVTQETSSTEQAVLERFFAGETPEKLFAESFLQQLPASELHTMASNITQNLGSLQNISGNKLQFQRGTVTIGRLSLDGAGKISGLIISELKMHFSSPEEIKTAWERLNISEKSLLVTEQNTDLLSLNAEKQLATGSSFKIAVLGELQAQIKAGKHQWEEQVTLEDRDKSLPSGTLQNEKSGTTWTLHELATRMIAQSDNTATDLLMRHLDRAAINARWGSPVLTTREALILKNPENLNLLQMYRQTGKFPPEAKEATMASVEHLLSGVSALDVEWHASARALCGLLNKVAAEDREGILSVNAGVANENDWKRVSYKGGSETGVLSLNSVLEGKNGKQYCVSASWNDKKPLNELILIGFYSGVLDFIR